MSSISSATFPGEVVEEGAKGKGHDPGESITLDGRERIGLTRRSYADTSSRVTKVSAVLTTKGVYARRRCRSCRRLFTPRPGGRPAVFCSASCKQRAYKTRKKGRGLPDARPTPAQSSSAHAIGPLVVTSQKGSIFEPEDVRSLLQKCRGARPSEEADLARSPWIWTSVLCFIPQLCGNPEKSLANRR